ncbi:MAG TPA: hypothetical protein VFV32_03125 [Acidimicrobiales bacterium]|nr:hypothetical protein [Acidimicrobiales bacterium]
MRDDRARRTLAQVRNASLALLAVAAVANVLSLPSAAAPIPGGAGTDTSLPLTDSAVVVHGRGPFSSLQITVNQTEDLVNQAVSVTWKGGTPTLSGAARFAGHYLQIMQCWGEDDGSVPANPGPPPEQCVQGATDAVYGGRLSGLFTAGNNTLTRVISRSDLPTYDPDDGVLDPATRLVWRPFRAVDGTEVGVHINTSFNPVIQGGSYWLNPYFNIVTTNEIPAAATRADGTGEELFEVATGVESTGLGCGQRVQPVPGGEPTTPKCWLVIVPRGDPAVENAGLTPRPELAPVFTSPLSTRAWENRIAVPLDFSPVDSSCRLSDDQRRLAGTEHLVGAISSWQRSLCGNPHLSPFAYGVLGDANARQQVLSGVVGAPGLVAVSRPYPPGTVDPANPVVYAPLAASGTVIGFNVERNPKPGLDPAEDLLRGIRVAEINLTPRLVAKLLTQSYRAAVAIGSSVPPYDWVQDNPVHLATDPDFLQFNPEFALLNIAGGKNMAGLLMPALKSDAAQQVWEWILADPEAKAWLDGQPDAWGMRVNPVFATTAAANSAGVPFASPTPDSYPKSDPYCYQAPPLAGGTRVVPPPLCGTDWLPYTQGLRDAARLTRLADDGAKIVADPFAEVPERVYKVDGPQLLGSRAILSLTDSASAVQYGLQMARLSRAGDNGPDRSFIAPDVASLSAGVESMRPAADPAFLEPDPSVDAPEAYPLTVLTYGAIAPLAQDAAARAEYAAFVDYAAGAGQVPGRELGNLPPGYAPLAPPLRAQATLAAETIRTLQPPAASTPTTEHAAARPLDGAGFSSSGSAIRSSRSGGSTPAPSTPTAPAAAAAGEEDAIGDLGVLTPILALARNRFVLPALCLLALLSALGALEITKRPRRSLAGPAPREAGSA